MLVVLLSFFFCVRDKKRALCNFEVYSKSWTVTPFFLLKNSDIFLEEENLTIFDYFANSKQNAFGKRYDSLIEIKNFLFDYSKTLEDGELKSEVEKVFNEISTTGGHQEFNLRAGTENVPAIVGLGKAVEDITANIDENNKYLRSIRRYFLKQVSSLIHNVSLNGHQPIIDGWLKSRFIASSHSLR